MDDVTLPEILYSYWDDLPVIIELDPEINKKLRKNPLRNYIIKSVSRGVIDTINGKGRRRHAMTVKEMVDMIEEFQGEKVKKSNLYYHLQVLIDLGIMKEVESIKEGNIITTYFGRTSKLVMMSIVETNSEEENIEVEQKHQGLEQSPDFRTFLKRMQLKHDSDEDIDAVIEEMERLKADSRDHEQRFKEWITDHAMELRGLDIDLIRVFSLYSELFKQSVKHRSVFQSLEKILKVTD